MAHMYNTTLQAVASSTLIGPQNKKEWRDIKERSHIHDNNLIRREGKKNNIIKDSYPDHTMHHIYYINQIGYIKKKILSRLTFNLIRSF